MDKRRESINSESKIHSYVVMEVKTTIKQLKDCCATRYICNWTKNVINRYNSSRIRPRQGLGIGDNQFVEGNNHNRTFFVFS